MDLSKHRGDFAVYLPAISGFYTELLGRCKHIEGYIPDGRIPEGFEHGFEGLNFLDADKGYFKYNMGLYSAGHAYLDMEKSKKLEYIIQDRDRDNTMILGDSGGFQIGKGVIKFDWENFFEKPGDPGYKGDADKTRHKILNWLEHTADWSMTLDVPSWASKPELRERTGLKDFDECLKCTLHNNDFFVQHRQGKTKFLNVLQGTHWEDASIWYDAVKDYPFEGWAMGGNHMRDMKMCLKRLIVMRDDGNIEGKDWIHYLGTSKLDWAVMFTIIQRELRKINPNITISFDSASPFISSANGLVYSQTILSADRQSYLMDKCFDNKLNNENIGDLPFPFESPVGLRTKVKDVNWYKPGMLNKIGKEGKTSWDSFTYGILMIHNVYMHIRAVQRANQLAVIETQEYQPDWRNWERVKRSDKSKEFSQWVPRNILYFNTFVQELFASEDPHGLLDEATLFLEALNNNPHKDGNNKLFQSLFEEEVTEADDNSFDENDEVLANLEAEFKNA
jgi:hypothetical protein